MHIHIYDYMKVNWRLKHLAASRSSAMVNNVNIWGGLIPEFNFKNPQLPGLLRRALDLSPPSTYEMLNLPTNVLQGGHIPAKMKFPVFSLC